MKLENNTILITGGSTGIGFGFAEYFSQKNKVIICGRSKRKLEEAKKKIPKLEIYECDVSKKEDCNSLFENISKKYPDTNVLINNAGIQREVKFFDGITNDFDEIDINLKGPIYLSNLFAKFISKKSNATIINISSGLAFVPSAMFPIYCATKAGLHSFTMSLRRQLSNKGVEVIEIIPPMIHDTLLKGKNLKKTDMSISVDEFLKEVIKNLKENKVEIPVGQAKYIIENSKKNIDKAFEEMNKNFYF
ncbi:MAG: SDR family NAD(P)-dependent oxidoreductase [Candidatus Micrarchaeaceae archaeon]